MYLMAYEQPDMPEPGDEQFREECDEDCDCEDCQEQALQQSRKEAREEPTADEVWAHYNP